MRTMKEVSKDFSKLDVSIYNLGSELNEILNTYSKLQDEIRGLIDILEEEFKELNNKEL